MQSVDATAGGNDLIPQFLQHRTPRENTVAVVVYQKNQSG
jgi:hypothetical protein